MAVQGSSERTMIRESNLPDLPECVSLSANSVSRQNTGSVDTAGDAASCPRRRVVAAASAGPSFALVSPCGHGNLGDASIQDAVIAYIRRRFPDSNIRGITLNPADTLRRHGVFGFPISGASITGYCVATASGQSAPEARSRPGIRASMGSRVVQALVWAPIRIA